MPILNALPHGGINRIFPEHRLTTAEEQKVRELTNLMSLNGSIYKIPGSIRYDSAKGGFVRWAKRIYYTDTGQRKRTQFQAIGKRMYALDEDTGNVNQVPIDGKLEETFLNDSGFFRDTTLKIAETVTTYLVDGKDMFKYDGNNSGNWDKILNLKDVDGETIEPIDIVSYLDRAFVLDGIKNRLYYSKTRNPEVFNDSDSAGYIELPPGNGGFPKSLMLFRGYLYIVHEGYITPMSGKTQSTFGIPPGNIIWGFGSTATRSVVNLKNTFAFLNTEDNEYYETAGTLDTTSKVPLSYELDLKSLINPNKADQTTATVHDNLLYISYVKNGEALLNAEVIYSIIEEKWCGQTEDRHVACYSPWNGLGDKNELIIGRSDEGTIMKTGTGLDYDELPVHYKFISASYLIDHVTDVNFEYLWVDGKPTGDHQIPLYYYIDTQLTTRGENNVYMQGEVTGVGFVTFADQTSFINQVIPKLDRSRGRAIRFQFEETIKERDFEIFGLFAQYNALGTKTTKHILGN